MDSGFPCDVTNFFFFGVTVMARAFSKYFMGTVVEVLEILGGCSGEIIQCSWSIMLHILSFGDPTCNFSWYKSIYV